MDKPKYSFRTLFFEASRSCNLACEMCMASSNRPDVVKASRKQELTTDEIEKHLLVPAKEIGIQNIIWSGGEFLLRPDAIELVRLGTRHGYSSVVTTNGKGLTREKLLALKQASAGTIVIAVGINSLDDDNVKSRSAEPDLAVRVLDMCRELNMRSNVVVTVGQHNANTLEQTLKWIDERQVAFNRSPFTARGSGRMFWDQMRVTRQDMEEKIHPALRKRPAGYVSYTPLFLSPELHESYSQGVRNVTVPQNPSIGCWCGTWLGISAEGEVAPCGILIDELNCGNVRDKPLSQIIDDSAAMQQVLDRSQLKGRCGRCRYKYTCGGCRAMAFFESGDIMGEDPTCFFEPDDETTVSEHEAETNAAFKSYVSLVRFAERLMETELKDATNQEDS